MPQVVNPKCGYLNGCNQQMVPTNFKHVVGLGLPTTGRAYRVEEIFKDLIKSGKKADLDMFKNMQLDVQDAFAREIHKLLIPFVEKHVYDYIMPGNPDVAIFNKMFMMVKKWNYMNEADNREALIFHTWYDNIMKGLLHKQIPDAWIRKSITTCSTTLQFLGRYLKKWNKGEDLKHEYCINDETKNTKSPCAYNVIKALIKTYHDIVTKFGDNEENWRWGYENEMRAQNEVFSSTPLRPFFERLSLSHVFSKQYAKFQKRER